LFGLGVVDDAGLLLAVVPVLVVVAAVRDPAGLVGVPFVGADAGSVAAVAVEGAWRAWRVLFVVGADGFARLARLGGLAAVVVGALLAAAAAISTSPMSLS